MYKQHAGCDCVHPCSNDSNKVLAIASEILKKTETHSQWKLCNKHNHVCAYLYVPLTYRSEQGRHALRQSNLFSGQIEHFSEHY